MLAARGWRHQNSRSQMTKLLTKMVENANVIFSKKSDNGQEEEDFDVLVMDWKCPESPKICEEDNEQQQLKAARIEKYSQEQSIYVLKSRSSFKTEITLQNGKAFKVERENCMKPHKILYDGMEIASFSLYNMDLFGDKIAFYFSEGAEHNSVVSVIDLPPVLAGLAAPVFREICRWSSGGHLDVVWERRSGKFWWVKNGWLHCQGRQVLDLSLSEQIEVTWLALEEDYVLISYYSAPYKVAGYEGTSKDMRFAVYHRKSGALLLEQPSKNNTRIEAQLLRLAPRLHLLLYWTTTELHFTLLSGKQAATPRSKPGYSGSRSMICTAEEFICTRKDSRVLLYVKFPIIDDDYEM